MTTFLTDAGYWALIVFAFVQACCIPISSEITFGFAGVLAFEGHLSLPLVIIIGTLAELAGSTAAYGLGRRGGRSTVERYRRYDKDGNARKGDYATWFEEEYRRLAGHPLPAVRRA